MIAMAIKRVRSQLHGLAIARLSDLAVIFYYGKARWCPVCGQLLRCFRKFGRTGRPEALCVRCGALERHRFVWLFLGKNTDLFDGAPKRMLHVAPERCLERHFRSRLKDDYLTADLADPRADVRMDVTTMPFGDASFDVVYCSHVLEQVADDRQALREFHRILRPGGWAVLLVPVTGDTTIEDTTITDPHERLRRFGHKGYVRRYGSDYLERLGEAGFRVTVTHVADMFDPTDALRMGLGSPAGEICQCAKA